MTNRMQLLTESVKSHGQAAVARATGYSVSAINQAVHGKYAGSLDNLLARVAEVYGDRMVQCPIVGEITIQRCAAERRKPFGATNPQRCRLYFACRDCTAHR